MVKEILVLKLASEIHLKTHFVKQFFVKKLLSNIKVSLKNNSVNFKVIGRYSGILICETDNNNKAVPLIQKVFGVHSVSLAESFSFSSLNNLNELFLKYAKKNLFKGDSFALRISRNGKHDFSSKDAAVQAGQKIMDSIKGLTVNLSNPKKEIFADIINKKVFLYSGKFKCLKGLPVGVEGKVGVLMEGRKEELISSFLMLKRGCNVFPVITKMTPEIKQNLKLLLKFNSFTEFKPVFLSEIEKEKNFLSALVSSETNEKKLNKLVELQKEKGFVVFFPLVFFPEKFFNEILEVIK